MIWWLLLAALPLFSLSCALLNAATWRRGDPKAQGAGSISLLIPARNEEKNIERALLSIPKVLDGPKVREILVYDDKSTDATRRIVQRLMTSDERIRLLHGVPLPSGWVGKPHALSQLAQAAKGDFLLFMDADVELKPEGLARLISLTLGPVKGQVVTAMPQQLTGTFFERLVLPLLPLTYLSWLPLRLVEWGTDGRTVAANGQLLLIRRQDYLALGGFDAVKSEIVDDVAFCKHAKTSGKKVVFADGTLMARCRMYEGARQTMDGFSKNLYEGVGGRMGTFSAMILYFLAFLAPHLGVLVALLRHDTWSFLFLPSLTGSLAIIGLQLLLVARYRQPKSGLVLHPLSILAFLAICLNSWRWQARGRVVWAGRTYASMENRLKKLARSEAPSEFVPPKFKERVQ